MILKILKTMPKSPIHTEIKNQISKEKGFKGLIKVCKGVFNCSPLIYLSGILFLVSVFDINQFNQSIIIESKYFRGFSFFYFTAGFIVLKDIRFINLTLPTILLFNLAGKVIYFLVSIETLFYSLYLGIFCFSFVLLDYYKNKGWISK